MMLNTICTTNIPTNNLFNKDSTEDIFNIGSLAFFINLQL